MGPSFGEWLPYDEIPPIMRDAMVAVEDRRFRSHPGVDPIGMARGLWLGLTGGDRVRGVSTITQQLARNIFLTNDRTFARKVREGILALALEWRFSKDQILELYLNRVYFGGGAYGIDAASRRFFGHSATELSIAEAAIIAGLVKAPSNYSPTADAEAARGRAGVVIDLMVRNGAITPGPGARPPTRRTSSSSRNTERQNITRYFTDWVLPQLDMLIDETVAAARRLDDDRPRHAARRRRRDQRQCAAGRAGRAGLARPRRRGAGDGRRPRLCRIRATTAPPRRTASPARRSNCSSIWPRSRPATSPTRTVEDAPITIGGWTPRNDSGRYVGPVPLRHAFAYSINTVAVRLAQEVGTRAVADMAQRFGITTRVNTNPVDGAGLVGGAADRHDPRLCRGRRAAASRSRPTASAG